MYSTLFIGDLFIIFFVYLISINFGMYILIKILIETIINPYIYINRPIFPIGISESLYWNKTKNSEESNMSIEFW